MRRVTHLMLGLAIALAACSPTDGGAGDPGSAGSAISETTTTTTIPKTTTTLPEFDVSTPGWDDGGSIPRAHTCDGADVSPELDLEGVPATATSLVVIVDDPDAALGVWDHWVEFDIPVEPGSFRIDEGSSGNVGIGGANSWKVDGYMGPCPPDGEQHNYVFAVYAIDGTLDLPAGVDSDAVRKAMAGRIVAQDQVTGTYVRP